MDDLRSLADHLHSLFDEVDMQHNGLSFRVDMLLDVVVYEIHPPLERIFHRVHLMQQP